MRAALVAFALPLLAVGGCATEATDIIVGVYSSLPFNADATVRGVCIDVESRGLPVQRVVASVPAGVPPRRLFDFRIIPRDDDLSQPVTVTVVARTRPGCSAGLEVARTSRAVRFIPGERVRETFVLGGDPPPPTDAGPDVARPDVPVTPGCPAGQALCAGACTNTRIDPRNCGGCGMVCRDTMYCVNGACVCPAGQAVCDGMRCTDPRFDPDWCGPGTCGGRCPAVTNGTRLCQSGRCVYTCNDGFEPLGGMCVRCGFAGDPPCDRPMPCNVGLTACEGLCRDLQVDRAHCGTCALACPAGRNCVAGVCR